MENEMRNPAAIAAFAKGDIENAIVASTPGGIEAQEARGQKMLCASTDMPLELGPSREAFEKLGFTFGDKIDEVFQAATLPPGWQRVPSDHSMWSYIKDEQGRTMVSVFYKAAFYDRRAHARLERRYQPDSIYPDDKDAPITKGVSDAGTMIWTAGETPRTYDHESNEALDAKVLAYIDATYPEWNDPTAYW